jgi:hypothetical protein
MQTTAMLSIGAAEAQILSLSGTSPAVKPVDSDDGINLRCVLNRSDQTAADEGLAGRLEPSPKANPKEEPETGARKTNREK